MFEHREHLCTTVKQRLNNQNICRLIKLYGYVNVLLLAYL